ncbi:hypothetical protein Q5P01_022483 [Channa striata]|uniref:Uncharacterized protein n=1 Tax=Channa striata TaxID=64152 RepID=A0AA88LLV3_CHASR|nr:hypothetical protein Q5P01_022483 [Channa striata]
MRSLPLREIEGRVPVFGNLKWGESSGVSERTGSGGISSVCVHDPTERAPKPRLCPAETPRPVLLFVRSIR